MFKYFKYKKLKRRLNAYREDRFKNPYNAWRCDDDFYEVAYYIEYTSVICVDLKFPGIWFRLNNIKPIIFELLYKGKY